MSHSERAFSVPLASASREKAGKSAIRLGPAATEGTEANRSLALA